MSCKTRNNIRLDGKIIKTHIKIYNEFFENKKTDISKNLELNRLALSAKLNAYTLEVQAKKELLRSYTLINRI